MAITAAVMLLGVCPVQADTEWYSGHHVITDDNEPFGEIYIYNTVTLDILGGDIFRLDTYDTTITNWYDGQMDTLKTHDDSIVNIYGGSLDILREAENSVVSLYGGSLGRFASDQNGFLNLYAYDVIHHTTGGYWNGGWVEGRYLNDNSYFDFDIPDDDTFLHINVIPEPTTLLLFGLGGLLLRKKR
jgi:hypothetical protein